MMKYIYFKDPDKKMNVVCNRVFSEEEGLETSKRLKLAMSKFLSKEISILGFLPEDTVVRLAVKATNSLFDIISRIRSYQKSETNSL